MKQNSENHTLKTNDKRLKFNIGDIADILEMVTCRPNQGLKGHAQNYIWDIEIWKYIEILIMFFFVNTFPMGVKISKRQSSYKTQPRIFKLVLNIPPNGPH